MWDLENQDVKCDSFLQRRIFLTCIIEIFCTCVSWRIISLYNPLAVLFGGVRRETDVFLGVYESVQTVERFFCVYIFCVLSKFLPCSTQNKCSPSQLTHDPHLCDVTVLLSNQSELRSFHLPDSYAAVRGEGKSSLHAQLCCC